MRRLNPYDELFLIGNELTYYSNMMPAESAEYEQAKLLNDIINATEEVYAFLMTRSVKEREFLYNDSVNASADFSIKKRWSALKWSDFHTNGKKFFFVSKGYLALCVGKEKVDEEYKRLQLLSSIASRYKLDFLKLCLESYRNGMIDASVGVKNFFVAFSYLTEEDLEFLVDCHDVCGVFYLGYELS